MVVTDIASRYFEDHGWRSIPIHSIRNGKCTCGKLKCFKPGKHPVRSWKNVHSLKNPLSTFRESDPDNLAILTGATSNLVVVDVDQGKGGYESLTRLEKKHGSLREYTMTSNTGGGGVHLYFLYDGSGVRTRQNALGCGIDILGDRGYIIAPPSKHISGSSYHWANGFYQPAALPHDLLEALRAPRGPERMGRNVPEGIRNTTLFKRACAMRGNGKEYEEILNSLLAYNSTTCHPPLQEREVFEIAASASRFPRGNPEKAYRDAWLAEIWSESGPPSIVRPTLYALSTRMNDDGLSCFPSQDLLTKITGTSDRKTIRKHIRIAEEYGWLRVFSTADWKSKDRSSLAYVATIPPVSISTS